MQLDLLTTQDYDRLNGLLLRVFDAMQDREWHTIEELACHCDGSENGTAAMIRRLRQDKYGGHHILRRRHPELGHRGVWQYCLLVRYA